MKNLSNIAVFFDQDEIQFFSQDDIYQLQEEIQPFYDFTTYCKGERLNQSRVYLEYQALKVKLENYLYREVKVFTHNSSREILRKAI